MRYFGTLQDVEELAQDVANCYLTLQEAAMLGDNLQLRDGEELHDPDGVFVEVDLGEKIGKKSLRCVRGENVIPKVLFTARCPMHRGVAEILRPFRFRLVDWSIDRSGKLNFDSSEWVEIEQGSMFRVATPETNGEGMDVPADLQEVRK